MTQRPKGYSAPKNEDPDALRKILEKGAQSGLFGPEVAESIPRVTPAQAAPDEDTRAREAARGLSALAAIVAGGHESGGVRGDDVSRLAGEAARGRRELARVGDKKRRRKAQKAAPAARTTRRERAAARRAAFLASMAARARGDEDCRCAPRDWVDAVYRATRPIVRGANAGKRARDLCLSAGMPREQARRLRRIALDVRRDADGVLRPHRAWGDVHARRVVVWGWAVWRMRARASAHGWGAVTAGISVPMIGALFPNLLRDEACSRQWVSEILAELSRGGFWLRRQPPPALRARMPEYYGPSGYGFNTYWFRDEAALAEEADDDPELDAAIESAPLYARELAASSDPPPLEQ